MTNETPQSAMTHGSGQSVSIRLVGTDKPLVTALAFAVALCSMGFSYWSYRQYEKIDENFGLWVDYVNELKGELIAHGVKVPPNPCTSKGACP